jgi:DNA uptake protein ComE-like DNA-binding protein
MGLTPQERLALQWLLAVLCIASGAQLFRHWRDKGATSGSSREALARQLVAVDSAQRADRRGSARGGARARRRTARAAGAADSVAPAAGGRRGGRRARGSDTAAADRAREAPTLQVVDVDRADSAQLERLPAIGPALASRIVAERLRNGPYGSLAGLERVRGIGPKLAQRLASAVTFSGTPRPLLVRH